MALSISSGMSAVRLGEKMAARFFRRQFSIARTVVLAMKRDIAFYVLLLGKLKKGRRVERSREGERGNMATDLVVRLHQIQNLRICVIVQRLC
jgi:hypothetical protein